MVSQAAVPVADGSSPLRALFEDRRIATMVGLGFSSGIPYLLIYVTQSAWLSDAGVPLGVLGLLSEMTLAYKFKFVWAPFLDRHDAPVLGRLLGRRRGWIVLSQLGIAADAGGRGLRRSRPTSRLDRSASRWRWASPAPRRTS